MLTMKYTIALSVDRVLEAVYADTALHHFQQPDAFPSVLGKANSAALRTLARNCCARIVYELIPAASGTSILNDSNPDIITIDFDTAEEIPALREALECALSQAILAGAWAGYKSELSELYADGLGGILSLIKQRLGGRPGLIEPAA